MTNPKQLSQTAKDQFKALSTLVESVRADSLTQFGEIKKDFGGINSTLHNHEGRIKDLERDKIERDAILKYKKEHPEVAQSQFNNSAENYHDTTSTVQLNRELIKAVGFLIVALGVVVAGIYALSSKP